MRRDVAGRPVAVPAEDIIPPTAVLSRDRNATRLSAVLDAAAEAMVVVDRTGTVAAVNRPAAALLGCRAGDGQGQNLFDLVSISSGGSGPDGLDRLAGGLQTGLCRHRTGAPFPVEVAVTRAAGDGDTDFVVVLRDLRPGYPPHRLTRLEAEHSRLGRIAALDQMGAAMAHELNQPLTAASLYLQAAERLIDAATPAAGIIAKARREAERANLIIRGMRQFAEHRPPDHRPVLIDPLVDEAIELTLVGRDRRTDIARISEAPGLSVVAEPIQLQQIVVNLMRNALEAVEGREAACVSVTTGSEAGRAILTIRDNGPGIPPARIADLFTPFKSTKPGGIGLGLAISRSIAEHHGGTIEVDAGGDGRGAGFTLSLPLAPPASPGTAHRSV